MYRIICMKFSLSICCLLCLTASLSLCFAVSLSICRSLCQTVSLSLVRLCHWLEIFVSSSSSVVTPYCNSLQHTQPLCLSSSFVIGKPSDVGSNVLCVSLCLCVSDSLTLCLSNALLPCLPVILSVRNVCMKCMT